MVDYCLDTSIIIEFLKGNSEVIHKIKNVSENNYLFLTSITLCEIYKGIYSYAKGDNLNYELNDIASFLMSVDLVSFDHNSCEEFGKIFSKLKDKGKFIPELDMMIASIVKSENLILITSDKHFKNLGIKVMIV